VLRIGDKLPSVRVLSEEYGISTGTAFQAYYHLEGKGLIESRPKSGYYVRFNHKRFPALPSLAQPDASSHEVSVKEMIASIYTDIASTGLMNFAALRHDPRVWPTNSAPFVLLVARNEASTTGDSFYFVSPKNEPRLSSIGQFRIDAQAALPISTESVQEDLFALKAVYKGGLLGAELLRRIQTMSVIPLGEQLKRHGLRFSSGFQLGQPVRRTRSAKHLLGLPIARPDMSFEVSGHGAEVFALGQDGAPAEAGLETFQAQLLEQAEIVVDRKAPFGVVVMHEIRGGGGPAAARLAVGAGDGVAHAGSPWM